jgi:hypothetical protein
MPHRVEFGEMQNTIAAATVALELLNRRRVINRHVFQPTEICSKRKTERGTSSVDSFNIDLYQHSIQRLPAF